MKVRFSIGSRHERNARFEASNRTSEAASQTDKGRTRAFDTSTIENEDARSFAEGLLKIFATTASEVKDLVDDFAAKMNAGEDGAAQAPDQARKVQDDADPAEDQSVAETPTPQPKTPESPCAAALQEMDLGDRSIDWFAAGAAQFGVVEVLPSDDQLGLWQTARDALRPGGCYPILVDRDGLEMLEEQISEELNKLDRSTGSTERMSALRREFFDRNQWPPNLPVTESSSYKSTVSRFGHGPTEAELAETNFQTQDEVEHFLWEWELRTFGHEAVLAAGQPENFYWHEYSANEVALLILPVPDAASVVQLIGFWPTDDHPEWIQPLGNDIASWHADFGAELVANYFTMLQFVVARPPRDLETSYRLAHEHAIVGTATLPLPGIETRHYAADLVGRTRWHLHDRP